MAEMRYRHELRRIIDSALGQVGQGELSWHEAAHLLDSHRVPFNVTCRVLMPYAQWWR